MKSAAAGRAFGLLLLTVLATLVVHRLVAAPLGAGATLLADLVAGRDLSPATATLDRLVILGSALALAVCWLRLVLGVLAGVLSCLTTGRGVVGARLARVAAFLGSRWVHGLTVAAVGVALAQAPAAAADPGGGRTAPSWAAGTTGLPLPDRASADPTPRPRHAVPSTQQEQRRTRTVQVRPGDSLWSIAAGLLPAGASDAAVHLAWRRIAAANAEVLGPDPDLIFPGTALRVPALDHMLGKELS